MLEIRKRNLDLCVHWLRGFRPGTSRTILSTLLLAFSELSSPAMAFPPYRSTDAETAGDDTLEARIGLLRLEVNDSHSTRKTPLSRINYGIGPHFEVISELEYAIDDGQFDEGALGFKWARLENDRGIGVETLVLLPVQSEQRGAGLESQLIRTWRQERSRVHVNAGIFYDPRGTSTERGWRASALAEFPRDRLRPGVELFVRDSNLTDTRMQAGVGLIASLERVEIRTGLHVGLNDAAPDLEASVWLSWKWQVPNSATQETRLSQVTQLPAHRRRTNAASSPAVACCLIGLSALRLAMIAERNGSCSAGTISNR